MAAQHPTSAFSTVWPSAEKVMGGQNGWRKKLQITECHKSFLFSLKEPLSAAPVVGRLDEN